MQMIKNEFKYIKSNKIIMISLFAIMFIPFLYSIFFLKSVWDPYGSTGNLPVAVVNQDKPVTYQGVEMHAGDDMVKELKKNDQLGWKFVSAKKAKEGLKDKKYYTVVTLPKNFSKNAATVLDKNPKKMQIEYKTNDSLNFIAEVISETAAGQLNSQVREAVTTVYSKVMFKQVATAGKGFSDAAKGAKQLSDGSSTLSDGLNVYTSGVDQVNDGVLTMKTSVVPLSNGVAQLASGAGQLSTGVGTYTNGVSSLNSGLQTLASKNGQLTSGASTLASGVDQLASGSGQLNEKLADASNKIDEQLNSNDAKQLPALKEGLIELNSAIQQMKAKVNDPANDNSKIITSDMEQAAGHLTATGKLVEDTGNKLDDINTRVYSDDPKSTASHLKTVGESLQKIQNDPAFKEFLTENPSLGIELLKVKSNLTDAGTQLQTSGVKDLQPAGNNLQQMGTELSDAGTNLADVKTQLGKTEKNTLELKAAINEMASEKKAPLALNGSVKAINTLTAGLNTVNAGLKQQGSTSDTMGGIQATDMIHSGLVQMQNGIKGTKSQPGLLSGMSAYTNGVATAANGSNQLAANSGALNSGAQQLAGGTGQLNAQIPTLTSGVNQLADGTQQLAANSSQLTNGAAQLNDGNDTLATSLDDGAKTINSIKLTDKTAGQFAAPSELKHSNYSKVPNYGHALAPYVLSLALYVGAIVFNFAFPIRKISMEGQSSTAWFLSKISVGAVVAVAMAIIEPALMMVAGLDVVHPGQMFAVSIAFSIASMAIVMFLSMTFDNPGRFVAMLLLMLQLGGSGGTFPMEVTNGFYNAIHPFLPMSYSTLGFRQAISSGLGNGQITQTIGVLALFTIISLGLLWLGMNYLQNHGNRGESILDDNQKLQEVEK